MVVTECFKEPDASVPETVIVYAPAGVPLLPPLPLLLPPPHAAWKTKPAHSTQASTTAVILPLLFCPEPKPTRIATNPISGKQSA